MNPNVSNDPWWHQSPDFYQQLESDFGFPPLSMKESQPVDIYATFDSYSKPTTPSHSEASGSHRPPNEPRESDSSVSSVFEVLKPVGVEKRERRREQNRSAQRAYRDRRETHQKKLEETIARLRMEHSRLSRHCQEQNSEVDRLKRKISELDGQLMVLRDGLTDGIGYDSGQQVFTSFDMVPHMWTEGSEQAARGSDGVHGI